MLLKLHIGIFYVGIFLLVFGGGAVFIEYPYVVICNFL